MAVSGAKEKKSMPLCKAAGDHIPTASLWRHRIQPGKTRNRPRTQGTLVDIPFPKKARNEWLTAGRAERHHILPDSGWISIFLRQASDVDRAIELLHLSFEIANQRTTK